MCRVRDEDRQERCVYEQTHFLITSSLLHQPQLHPSVLNHIPGLGHMRHWVQTRSVPSRALRVICMMNHSGGILRSARTPGGQVEQWDALDRPRLGNRVRVWYVRCALAPRYVTSTERTLIESLWFGLERIVWANGFCRSAKPASELYLSPFPSLCFEDTVNRREDWKDARGQERWQMCATLIPKFFRHFNFFFLTRVMRFNKGRFIAVAKSGS